ncbi:curli assembly protein CsgF [Methylobacterium sp. E-046]|uniref:curli assembly protein CsgF n=1 Tax=Methylobacterium sp. E-046 TaxID=2836576 RepID=UPI001FB88C8B|nr:curli assembly protein CsgF [Methylobacterium sp. E-046]MCJ2103206.1 curli assembly protein CsgF [Methylobacterium sp. E-046]
MRTSLITVTALLALATFDAQAGNLIYQPVNPAFGGSPLNGNWLQSEATAQNFYQREEQRRSQIQSALEQNTGRQSPGQLFAQQLQSQLYSSLANKITSAIFGENAQNSGNFSFQGTNISFQRIGTDVQVTINDGQTVTQVTVPSGP